MCAMAYFGTFHPLSDHNESINATPRRFEAPRYITKPAEPPGGFGVTSWPHARTWFLDQILTKSSLPLNLGYKCTIKTDSCAPRDFVGAEKPPKVTLNSTFGVVNGLKGAKEDHF